MPRRLQRMQIILFDRAHSVIGNSLIKIPSRTAARILLVAGTGFVAILGFPKSLAGLYSQNQSRH